MRRNSGRGLSASVHPVDGAPHTREIARAATGDRGLRARGILQSRGAKLLVRCIVMSIVVVALFGAAGGAAARDSERSFSFVVVGHIRGYENGGTNPLLDMVLAKVSRLRPDLMFLTGDMIWGFADEATADARVVENDWDWLDQKLKRTGVPVYRVPGNHDINDPVTRDIYFKRYGDLPRAITFKGSRFLLLNSCYVPEGQGPEPRKYIMGKKLDAKQIEFIRQEIAQSGQYDHLFVFMHHVLWWPEDAPWWRDVHPLLSGRNVRAVFSGDLGPTKFSSMRRDGIDYVRSAIEADHSPERKGSLAGLRSSEEDRIVANQFDNFLHVAVDGETVEIGVETVGALTSGKFSPQRWREVFGAKDPSLRYDPVRKQESVSLSRRIWAQVGSPRRLAALFVFAAVSFTGGVAAALVWKRRRPGRGSSVGGGEVER